MTIHLHQGDLPADVTFGESVAVDTEAMGLRILHDRLCLVQLSAGDGDAHLVQIAQGQKSAPNLQRLMEDPKVLKLFHFARFDIASLRHWLGIKTAPIYCSRIASRLVRTSTDKHGLKSLAKELIGVDMNKQEQLSDWGQAQLSPEQLSYAASDVLYLHKIKAVLEELTAREGRTQLVQACFDFLATRAELDLAGWDEVDIFAHH